MAKFKVGDKVLVTIGGKHTGKIGVVRKIVQTSPISEYTYLLSFEGESGNFPINEGGLRAANSCRNSVVANTKNSDGLSVGDKVKYRYMPGVDVDEIFKVIKDIDFQYVMIKRLSDGKEWKEFSHNLIPVRNSYSKNSVVANAIAWKAKNDEFSYRTREAYRSLKAILNIHDDSYGIARAVEYYVKKSSNPNSPVSKDGHSLEDKIWSLYKSIEAVSKLDEETNSPNEIDSAFRKMSQDWNDSIKIADKLIAELKKLKPGADHDLPEEYFYRDIQSNINKITTLKSRISRLSRS